MKGILIWITVFAFLAAGCSQAAAPTPSSNNTAKPPPPSTQVIAPAASNTPVFTPIPSSTPPPEPSATIKPSATPLLITDAKDLIGIWHRTTPSQMVGEIWRVYKEDGTYVVASTREQLETKPKVTGKYVFDGTDLLVTDLAGVAGWDECTKGEITGRYQVVVGEEGYIHFVKVEDACDTRTMLLPQGVYERIE